MTLLLQDLHRNWLNLLNLKEDKHIIETWIDWCVFQIYQHLKTDWSSPDSISADISDWTEVILISFLSWSSHLWRVPWVEARESTKVIKIIQVCRQEVSPRPWVFTCVQTIQLLSFTSEDVQLQSNDVTQFMSIMDWLNWIPLMVDICKIAYACIYWGLSFFIRPWLKL